jgi:Zn-dependent protease with chaperone function
VARHLPPRRQSRAADRGTPTAFPARLVVIAAFTIAIGQGFHGHQWGSVAVLASIAISVLAAPVIDAAASRAGEYEADQLAAHSGYGDDLSRALTDTDWADGLLSLGSRVLSRHPGTARRAQRRRQTSETLTRSV